MSVDVSQRGIFRIQRWFRRMKTWGYFQGQVDPFTLEPPTIPTFHYFPKPGHVCIFSALSLAKYLFESPLHLDPFTRQPFETFDIIRLNKIVAKYNQHHGTFHPLVSYDEDNKHSQTVRCTSWFDYERISTERLVLAYRIINGDSSAESDQWLTDRQILFDFTSVLQSMMRQDPQRTREHINGLFHLSNQVTRRSRRFQPSQEPLIRQLHSTMHHVLTTDPPPVPTQHHHEDSEMDDEGDDDNDDDDDDDDEDDENHHNHHMQIYHARHSESDDDDSDDDMELDDTPRYVTIEGEPVLIY